MTENLLVDVMHDILEGIARYDLILILRKIIYELRLVSLVDLNQRLHSFSYEKTGHVNKPPQLLESQIKNGYLIISSSEMLTLIKFICLIIGHSIPREIECWNLLTMLKSIIEILVSPIIHVQTPKLLATLITEYMMLHSEIF